MENIKKVITELSPMKKKILVAVLSIVIIVLIPQVCYEIMFKDYEKIHNKKVSADIPEYEVPILKVVELFNHRISDCIAYDKYNMAPAEYDKKIKELKSDEEESRFDEVAFEELLIRPYEEFGSKYEVSYEVTSVTHSTQEWIDSYEGVDDMYIVSFKVYMASDCGEDFTQSYTYKIAKIDGEWIFYNERFTPGTIVSDWETLQFRDE